MKKVFVHHPDHSVCCHDGILAHAPRDLSDSDYFTCPMHPSLRRTGPGFCPDCGVALEPLVDRGQGGSELKTARWHFYVSFLCSAVVLSMVMGETVFGPSLSQLLSPQIRLMIELVFSMPVCLWVAWPFYERGLWAVKPSRLNMFTLISIGVILVFVYSVMATLTPHLFPHLFLDQNGQPFVYFEAAVVIVTLIWLGQVLELKARDQTSSALRELMKLSPASAHLLHSNGSEQDIELDLVKVGDVLRVRPGEKIPIDSVVMTGKGLVDEFMISGEQKPLEKLPGDRLFGATLNLTAVLVIEAKRIASETVFAQIIRGVSEAQRSRACFQKFADRVAQIFVPIVIGVAVLTFVVWFNLGPEPQFQWALLNAIAVLIIACPYALGLATPMSVMVAIGRGARAGVIFKNAEAIEQMAFVNTLILDKTGTLTEGNLSLSAIEVCRTINRKNLVKMAASLAQSSEHPLSKAMVSYAQKKSIVLGMPENFIPHPGLGISGVVESAKVIVGSRIFLEQFNIDCREFIETEHALSEKSLSVALVAINGRAMGVLGFSDELKEGAESALNTLKSQGLRIILATGDNEINATRIAHKFAIKEVYAGISPEGRAGLIESLQRSKARVALVSDRTNNAPASSQAHLSIAMDGGSNVALNNADITLLKGDLNHLARARKLSRSAMRNIKQNLFWAFFYNIIGVPIAAGILYPSFGIVINPMMAAAAMSLSSISVIVNALRLRTMRL